MMGVAVGKDDDIAGPKLDGLSVGQAHERSAVNDEVVDHKVWRARGKHGREHVRCG